MTRFTGVETSGGLASSPPEAGFSPQILVQLRKVWGAQRGWAGAWDGGAKALLPHTAPCPHPPPPPAVPSRSLPALPSFPKCTKRTQGQAGTCRLEWG